MARSHHEQKESFAEAILRMVLKKDREPYFKEDTTMNDTFMKEKPVFGIVLSMSLPMVLSMMVNALYNIVDSYFVARISEDAMTALSLS